MYGERGAAGMGTRLETARRMFRMGEGLKRAFAAARATQLPDVKVGQVWTDRDYRMKGRKLKVVRLDSDFAYCKVLPFESKEVRILLRRFRPTSTGYDLVASI